MTVLSLSTDSRESPPPTHTPVVELISSLVQVLGDFFQPPARRVQTQDHLLAEGRGVVLNLFISLSRLDARSS